MAPENGVDARRTHLDADGQPPDSNAAPAPIGVRLGDLLTAGAVAVAVVLASSFAVAMFLA